MGMSYIGLTDRLESMSISLPIDLMDDSQNVLDSTISLVQPKVEDNRTAVQRLDDEVNNIIHIASVREIETDWFSYVVYLILKVPLFVLMIVINIAIINIVIIDEGYLFILPPL